MACVNVVSVEIEDEVNFADLEASFPLSESSPSRFRIRATQVSGSFDQNLDSDELVRLDNSRISGPAELTGDIDLTYVSFAFGQDDRTVTLAPGAARQVYFFGIAQTQWDLDVAGGGNQLKASDDTTELYFQYGFFYTVRKSLDLGFTWAASVGDDASGISEIDLKLNYSPHKNLALTAGYRWFDYEYGLGDNDSHIDVDFRGPFLGISLPF
jgi:hypothetical protein